MHLDPLSIPQTFLNDAPHCLSLGPRPLQKVLLASGADNVDEAPLDREALVKEALDQANAKSAAVQQAATEKVGTSPVWHCTAVVTQAMV